MKLNIGKEKDEENQKACSLAAADKGVDCQFNNIKMVFNTTLCGDWAGNAYEGGMEECRNYLIDNSGKITNKEWDISYIAAFSKIYKIYIHENDVSFSHASPKS